MMLKLPGSLTLDQIEAIAATLPPAYDCEGEEAEFTVETEEKTRYVLRFKSGPRRVHPEALSIAQGWVWRLIDVAEVVTD